MGRKLPSLVRVFERSEGGGEARGPDDEGGWHRPWRGVWIVVKTYDEALEFFLITCVIHLHSLQFADDRCHLEC